MPENHLRIHQIRDIYVNLVLKIVTIAIMVVGGIAGYIMIERRNIENQTADLIIKVMKERDLKARKDMVKTLKEIYAHKFSSSEMKIVIDSLELGISAVEEQIEVKKGLEAKAQQLNRQMKDLAHDSKKFIEYQNELQKIEIEKNMHEEELKNLPLISIPSLPKKIPKGVVAIVVGHTERSPGAINAKFNVSEYYFSKELAVLVEKDLDRMGIKSTIVFRRTYRDLPHDINALDPSIMISLHADAFNGKLSGSTTRYYVESKEGEKLAETLQKGIVEVLRLPNRGLHSVTKQDRGGYLLGYVKCPASIVFPFFIDNDKDFEIVNEKKNELALSIAKSIQKYLSEPPKRL